VRSSSHSQLSFIYHENDILTDFSAQVTQGGFNSAEVYGSNKLWIDSTDRRHFDLVEAQTASPDEPTQAYRIGSAGHGYFKGIGIIYDKMMRG
jgi:hypothetical protein